ncbi:DUF1853 family protein [Undibacterium terreum]|uniref:DUF1853 domain-containing protein n=1 Tax=Undibacterium terreum TaxID=1224302 RepID=A0A916XBN7_9BURK|nr:DUF1853 family protein [Undibacterium terreum]GGC60000.1 hypothetical protein GCM10011396_03630 [Undibacterium terreum]
MEFQTLFHRYWQHLHDPHVRALAWMLTSPDMLAAKSPVWAGQIATVPISDPQALIDWLSALDRQPAPLHQALELHKHSRLGHYAENLLAFYLKHQGILFAHGLQVRQGNNQTIGEFDFLVRQRSGLAHWELATKFYLFDPGSDDGELQPGYVPDLYSYVGPNLADTLGAKMKKTIEQQLPLAQHPLAQFTVQEPIARSQALIKGWLFYRDLTHAEHGADGISSNHCRGFWWFMDDLEKLAIPYAMVLPRLQWLAPAQARAEEVMDKPLLLDSLLRHFARDSAPAMVAIMRKSGDLMQEICRGVVVPDKWMLQAAERRGLLRSPLI